MQVDGARLLDGVDVLQLYAVQGAGHARNGPAERALRLAACLAGRLGARSYVCGQPPDQGFGFYDLDETPVEADAVPGWLAAGGDDPGSHRLRLILETDAPEAEQGRRPAQAGDARGAVGVAGASPGEGRVTLLLEPWQTEETLFAASGLAHLLGDPEREPLVPAANYAAHSLGYTLFAAVAAIAVKHAFTGVVDSAAVSGSGALAWINWKAAVEALEGQDLCRQGLEAEWPVVECADGYAALVYNDWGRIVEWVGDPVLASDKFATFPGRARNRGAYVGVLRKRCRDRTKADLADEFEAHGVPAAPVLTVSDLLVDPLVAHRQALRRLDGGSLVPEPPHRFAAERAGGAAGPGDPDRSPAATAGAGGTDTEVPMAPGHARGKATTDRLPLHGIRVLDFGAITAGAGVSALLADLGAEVLKIESFKRPDPFRGWGAAESGDEDAAVFKSNNRSKLGIALDLKSEEDKRAFLDLVAGADIVLENFRRRVLDRLGLGFDVLREANPSILLASISGQGLDGPGTRHATFGSTLEANSGFAALTRYPAGPPVISGRNLNYPDQVVCLYAPAIIALAVEDCKRRRVSRHIDISQRDCAIFQLGDVIAHVSAGGDDAPSAIRDAIRGGQLSGLFRCADGRYAALAASRDSRAKVAKSVPELTSLDPEDVRRWAETRGSDEAIATFLSAGGGAALARVGEELLNDDALHAAQVLERSPNGALVKGFPFQLRKAPMTIRSNSPAVGEHNAQVLGGARSAVRAQPRLD